MPYEAIVVAAHLLDVPITVLQASELDYDATFPNWSFTDASMANRPWIRGDVNKDHILLIHHVGHFDATVPQSDGFYPTLKPFTLRKLVGEADPYAAHEHAESPHDRFYKHGTGFLTDAIPDVDTPVPWHAMRSLVTGSGPSFALQTSFYNHFRNFNYDPTIPRLDPAYPKPVASDHTFVFLPLGTYLLRIHSLSRWIFGEHNVHKLVVVMPLVESVHLHNAHVWTVVLTVQSVQIIAPYAGPDVPDDWRRVRVVEGLHRIWLQTFAELGVTVMNVPAPTFAPIRIPALSKPDSIDQRNFMSMCIFNVVAKTLLESPTATFDLTLMVQPDCHGV